MEEAKVRLLSDILYGMRLLRLTSYMVCGCYACVAIKLNRS